MKRETNYFLPSLLILLTALRPAGGQTAEKDELYKLPDEYCLTLVALQKTAPVQFAGIEALIRRKGGRPSINWILKNNSSKTVRRFEVAFKIRSNVGALEGNYRETAYDVGTDEAKDLILPNGTYTEFTYPQNPLPDEIRNWFKPKDEWADRKFVLVYGMIKKVVFSDGTVYEDNNKIFEDF